MAYNRRSGGGGYGGYNSGGRYNGGGYRSGSSSNVSPWQSNSGNGGPSPRQSQGGAAPALAMASNIISKLLTSSTSMAGSGYNGGPNRNVNWNNGGSRMAHMPMRQRHDGPGGYSKDNRRRGDNKFSGGNRKSGGAKDGEKRKSGKVNDENKKGPNERERTKEQLDLDKKASYVGVPSAVLYCHVCSKHMWDSESFEKHVRGRPHELMMTYLDEAYRMRVDFMRHQIKAVENQREIDLERVTNNKHKANKANTGNKTAGGNANSSKPLLRSYCPMCDVRFYGPLTGHRKSDRHRKLKQFLHPECKLCDALFHTRLEMDEHKLTAGHLKKVAEQRNIENPHLKNDEFDLIDMIKIEEDDQDHDQMPVAKKYEMLTDRDATKLKLELEGGSSEKHREKKNLAVIESDSAQVSDDKTMEVDEDKKGEQDEDKEGEQDEDKEGEQYEDKEDEQYEDKEAEGEQYDDKNGEEYDEKLDENNDTSGVVSTSEEAGADKADQSIKDESLIIVDSAINKDNQAAYDPDVAIGQDLLIPSKGYVCRLCNCFLLDEQRVSIHCQTAAHYINYTTMTKMKEATSGGKKRGIDEVDADETEIKTEPVDEEEALLQELLKECGDSQEVTNNSEGQAAKRIKLESDEVKKEENEIDNSEEPIIEDEPMVVENDKESVEKPVENVQPVAAPVVAAAEPLSVAAAEPVADAAKPVADAAKPEADAAKPVEDAAKQVVADAAKQVAAAAAAVAAAAAKPVAAVPAKPVAPAPVTTPNRGRGGRGRGHRGGGVARRGNRR